MQTHFSPAQLADPDIAASDQVLRTCVHCGFCTATCPTFVLLGDELDSPRGRIYLMKQMLEDGGAPSAAVVKHVDRCLSCLSCMTTCPSGVNYMHLVDNARRHIEDNFARPWHDRALRAVLAFVLTRPAVFRVSLRLARIARYLDFVLPRKGVFFARVHALLALAPGTIPPALPAATHAAIGPRRARVALLAGCAQGVLAPHITRATIGLLTRMGVEVVVAPAQTCCGALPHHMGKQVRARALAEQSIAAWYREISGAGLDAIIIDTSGCGTTIKDYGHMFRESPTPLREQAETIAGLAQDITEFLDHFGYTPTRTAPPMRVAYHAACSLQHGQGVVDAPKKLLYAAGFTVVTPRDAHLCCGSAGTYNMLQPEISAQLRDRKVETLAALAPDVIATGNIGCLTQLGGRGIPAVHTVELLNWMAGGEMPAGVDAGKG